MTARLIKPSGWPVIVKVPLVVTLLMVAVSAVLTKEVLDRLVESQERHFRELTAAYLDGLSSSVMPGVLREDSWEIFDHLDRARSLYRGLTILETVVANAEGIVLASSNPRRVPAFVPVPHHITQRLDPTSESWLDEGRESAGVRRSLVHQDRAIGTIYAQFDVGAQFKERRAVLWTLVGTNAVITLLLATTGFLLVRRLLRPVHVLTRHFRRSTSGALSALSESELGPEHSEFGRLFRHYNTMVLAWNEREAMAARMAEEERLASLGRLASGMAHEINNPLGGLFNAIETLKRHGHHARVRERAISLLDRGLADIRDVVRSALVTYRADAANRPLKPADVDDLRLLIAPEIERRGLALAWQNDLVRDVQASAGAIRQAVLNVLLNACQVSPRGSTVRLDARHAEAALLLRVTDQGPGLDAERIHYLEDHALVVAPRTGESGLGLWIIRRLIAEVGGAIRVERADGATTITIMIPDAAMEGLRHVA